jgi:phage gp46-like protein
MTQVLVRFDAETQTVDLVEDENGYISLGAGLETASLFSLGSNRRARPSDNKEDQPFGWWGDNFPEVEGDEFGSHMWIVRSLGKLTTANLRRAQLAGEAAFAWMLADGLAKTVSFTAVRHDPDVLGLEVRILRPDGEVYSDIWKVHEDGI